MAVAAIGTEVEEAELCGSLFEFPWFFPDVYQMGLRPSHFSDGAHGALYDALCELHDQGSKPDLTLAYALYPERFAAVGYFPGVNHWCARWPENVLIYASRIMDADRRRRLLSAAERAAHHALDPDAGIDDVVTATEKMLAGLRPPESEPSTSEFVTSVGAELVAPVSEDTEKPKTGLSAIDKILGHMKPGQLILPAARTGVGKSSFATTVAWHVARGQGLPVAMFTYEMTREEIAQKFLVLESGLEAEKLESHCLNEREAHRLTAAAERLAAAPLDIWSGGTMRVGELCDRIRSLHAKRTLALAVVDYIQIIPPDKGHERRDLDVSSLSSALYRLAIELSIPIMAPAQIGRDADAREPKLTDLRESGSLEMDAAVVIFLWHKPDECHDSESVWSTAVNIAKNRRGPTGRAVIAFRRPWTQFVNAGHSGDIHPGVFRRADERAPWDR